MPGLLSRKVCRSGSAGLRLGLLLVILIGAVGAARAQPIRRSLRLAPADPSEIHYLPIVASPGRESATSCSVAVMPVGDSITYGYGSRQLVGYRRELYRRLVNAGYAVNFVGSRQGGLLFDFDRDNEGHPGVEAYYIRDHMPEYLRQNHPDVVMLHIGTNGIWYKSAEAIAGEIDGILSEIYRFDSDTMVILARIINRVNPDHLEARTTTLNELIQQLADARIRAGDPLAVVDMEHALIYTAVDGGGQELLVDMYDSLHPNEAGYQKMVAVWDTALQSHLRRYCASERAPRLTSSPPATALVHIPYRYRVEASGNPAPIFSLRQSPAGMTIDPHTGLIAWSPATAGNFTVMVEAANGVSPPAAQALTIHVAATSACPAETAVYYHLDEVAPPFADALGGPSAQCGSCPSSAGGQVNRALWFDGAGSGLTVAAGGPLFNWSNTDDFSLEFWLRRPGVCQGSTVDDNEVVAGRIDPSSNLAWWVGLSCQHGGRARFVLRDSDSDGRDLVDVVSRTALTDGKWHHVAVVRDVAAIDARIYVDGALEGAAMAFFSSGFSSASAALTLGWLDLAHGFHFEGALDEVAVYDRALTEREIYQHYALGAQGRPYCTTDAGQ